MKSRILLTWVGLLALVCSALADKVPIGQLGQTIQAAKIFSRPSAKAHVYYRSKQYEYLIIRSTSKPAWTGVLMSNGVEGFVQSESVAKLPYVVKVDRPEPTRPSGSLASRSGKSPREAVAEYSENFLGTPYKWGGNDLYSGIDCSGFVKKMYGDIGIDLPRTAAQQALVGTPITNLHDLKSGDRLYFWDYKRGKIGHTGIYLGGTYFIHSSMGKGGVAVSDLTKGDWLKILVAARR